MSELVTCPKCGLSQSARHSFCARCDHAFGSPAVDEETPSTPVGDVSEGLAGSPAAPVAAPVPVAPPSTPPRAVPVAAPSTPPRAVPARPRSVVDETQESPPSASGEEGLPDAPSWNLPNRAAGSNPGRARNETARSRAPGLQRDRGSLTRRERSGSSLGVEGVASDGGMPSVSPTSARPEDGVDSISSGRSPGPRDPSERKAPLPWTRTPAGVELRGRPPSSLYPAENSAPPGDPLIAALVSGEDIAPPPPDILADDYPVERPRGPRTNPRAQALLYPEGPPTGEDFGAVPAGALDSVEDALPRVVPPASKRRTSVGAAQQEGLQRDPRGRPVASPPPARGGLRPDTEPAGSWPPPAPPAGASASGSIVAPGLASSLLAGAAGRAERRTTRPASEAPGIGGPPPKEIDLPPPPAEAFVPHRMPIDVRRVVLRAVALLVLGLLARAAWDAWRVFDSLGTLNAVIGEANTATPAMVGELRGQVEILGLEGAVQESWATISGESETWSIGVRASQRVVGIPLTYTARRDGAFRLDQKLATLDYFVDNGWVLDGAAETRLAAYRDQRAAGQIATPEPAEPAAPGNAAVDAQEAGTPDQSPSGGTAAGAP